MKDILKSFVRGFVCGYAGSTIIVLTISAVQHLNEKLKRGKLKWKKM